MTNDKATHKVFNLEENFESKDMQEFLSWLRFVHYDEDIDLLQGFS